MESLIRSSEPRRRGHPDAERGGDDRRNDRSASARRGGRDHRRRQLQHRWHRGDRAAPPGRASSTLAERGYGRACAAGVAAAGEGCGIILFLDGDGADRADLADMLVAPIRAGTHDFVIGSRVRGEREPGSMSWHQVLAGRLAGWLMSLLYGVRYTDMCAFRAISREALARLDMRETDLWLEHRDADEGGARRPAHPGTAGAVSLPRRRQLQGRRDVGGSIRAGWRIISTIARIAVWPARKRSDAGAWLAYIGRKAHGKRANREATWDFRTHARR